MDNRIISYRSPNLILAGIGALEKLGEEAKALGAKKTLLVSDKGVMESGIGDKVHLILKKEEIAVDLFDKVDPDPAIECAESCIEVVKKNDYDLIIGLGGGSPMDIASISSVMCKNQGPVREYLGINLVKNPGIPTFLIPTTAGTGAEVTPNAVLADVQEKTKKAIISPYILPRVAFVDPLLTVSMPPRVTAFTGMDALTHAIEAFTTINATIMTDLFAREAIKIIGQSLRTATAKGENLEARYDMSIGSLYAGIALANAGVTMVHAMSYPMGGEFNVPHGVGNGLLLPHVMEFNVPGSISKFAQVARLMGEKVEHLSELEQAYRSSRAVLSLLKDLPVPHTLTDLNIPKEAIPRMAEDALKITRLLGSNPREMTVKDAERIYEKAL